MCVELISADLAFDCDNKDIQGIETNVVLINRDDIDYATTTYDPVSNTITNLQLQSGKTGYLLQGVKQLNSFLSEVVVNDDSLNKVRHSFLGRVYNLTAANRAQVDALMTGVGIVAVVEKKWKGAGNTSAFVVLGLGTGMEISEGSENSSENDGAFVFTLASADVSLESNGPRVLLETDYATTKTAFDAKFVQP